MEVIQLPKAKTFEQHTNEQAVEILENTLQRAKDGEVLELVLMMMTPDGIEHLYTGTNDVPLLVGHLEAMKFRQLYRMYGQG